MKTIFNLIALLSILILSGCAGIGIHEPGTVIQFEQNHPWFEFNTVFSGGGRRGQVFGPTAASESVALGSDESWLSASTSSPS